MLWYLFVLQLEQKTKSKSSLKITAILVKLEKLFYNLWLKLHKQQVTVPE